MKWFFIIFLLSYYSIADEIYSCTEVQSALQRVEFIEPIGYRIISDCALPKAEQKPSTIKLKLDKNNEASLISGNKVEKMKKNSGYRYIQETILGDHIHWTIFPAIKNRPVYLVRQSVMDTLGIMASSSFYTCEQNK